MNKRFVKAVIMFATLVAGVVFLCRAATYHVDATFPDDSGDGLSWATAKHTIQAAVDLAGSGDTVLVAPGVYKENGKAAPGGVTNTEFNYNLSATNSWVGNSCLWPDITGQNYDMGGNISADPLFVGGGDFRLIYRSPCVDSGANILTLSNDLNNVTRPIDGKVDGIAAFDMGCYEYIPPPAGTIVNFK